MVRSHGHFVIRKEAVEFKEMLEQNEQTKLKNPRVKITRNFKIKKLASGKYSVQSSEVYRKGYTKKHMKYKNEFNLNPNSTAYRYAVKKKRLEEELLRLQIKAFGSAPPSNRKRKRSVKQLQADIKYLKKW